MLPNAQLLPLHSAKQVRQDGKQFYIDPHGARLPSVTTILDATKPQAQREMLVNWRKRVGTVEANRIAGAASRRGTGTHKQIQCYLQGKDALCPEPVKPYWESLKPVLQDIQDVKLIEGSVFHYDLSYAGKVDCVASYRGIPCVCEWKTADRPKGTVEYLHDYPLQLMAYLEAVNHYYQEYKIDLKHALLVVAVPEMPAEVFWFEPEAIKTHWQAWEQRLTNFWQLRLGTQFT
jgi:genome maintenance exonuclease 1